MILDTSAYSQFDRGSQSVGDLLNTIKTVHIPLVVVAELKLGYLYGSRSAENLASLMAFISKTSVDILSPDLETSDLYAEIGAYAKRKGISLGVNDTWIAALAIQHKLPLATYDKDFDYIRELLPSKLHILEPNS